MTRDEKTLIHYILIEAKSKIKDGKLYSRDGRQCKGICEYLAYHERATSGLSFIVHKLFKESEHDSGQLHVDTPYDFASVKRLNLIDYLIDVTK